MKEKLHENFYRISYGNWMQISINPEKTIAQVKITAEYSITNIGLFLRAYKSQSGLDGGKQVKYDVQKISDSDSSVSIHGDLIDFVEALFKLEYFSDQLKIKIIKYLQEKPEEKLAVSSSVNLKLQPSFDAAAAVAATADVKTQPSLNQSPLFANAGTLDAKALCNLTTNLNRSEYVKSFFIAHYQEIKKILENRNIDIATVIICFELKTSLYLNFLYPAETPRKKIQNDLSEVKYDLMALCNKYYFVFRFEPHSEKCGNDLQKIQAMGIKFESLEPAKAQAATAVVDATDLKIQTATNPHLFLAATANAKNDTKLTLTMLKELPPFIVAAHRYIRIQKYHLRQVIAKSLLCELYAVSQNHDDETPTFKEAYSHICDVYSLTEYAKHMKTFPLSQQAAEIVTKLKFLANIIASIRHKTIAELDLANRGLSDEDIDVVVEELLIYPHITCVDLSNNDFGDEGGAALAKLKLKKLNLRRTDICINAGALATSNIEVLDLTDTDIAHNLQTNRKKIEGLLSPEQIKAIEYRLQHQTPLKNPAPAATAAAAPPTIQKTCLIC